MAREGEVNLAEHLYLQLCARFPKNFMSLLIRRPDVCNPAL